MAKKRGVDAIDEQAESYSSGGIFAKLENDGDSMVVAFVGAIQLGMKGEDSEPCSEEFIWKNGKSEDYDPVKHAGEEPRLRIKWNIIQRNPETEAIAEEAQIWGGSVAFFRTWKKHIDRKGLGHWWEIERDGKAGSKKTQYRLYDVEQLTAEELEKLKKVELRDLEKPIDDDDEEEEEKPRRAKRNRKAKASSEQSNQTELGSNGSSSISDEQAKEIRETIKGLDNAEAVYLMFKKQFSIEKVKELPASKLDDAAIWIKAMAEPAKPDTETENDPFD